MEKTELHSYALDFASYLLSNVGGIQRIILFGSTARGDFDKDSDIDLFIDTADKKLEKTIPQLADSFYNTEKAKRWKLKGITAHFSCLVGELDSSAWTDLKRSIINHGIILYGRYKAETEKVHQYVIFTFGNIVPESKRVVIHRKLFGFNTKKKKYNGLAQTLGLLKLGKGSLLVKAEHVTELKGLFKKSKVTVRLYDVWSDSELI